MHSPLEKAYQSPSRMEKTLHSIKYEGNLFKRGRGKKLAFVKPWRIRRFVLDTISGDFTYYKDFEGKAVKKGYLNVSKATTVKVDKAESGKDYSFRVSVAGEDLYLACSNDKDIDMWIDALNFCSKKVMLSPRRRSSSKPNRAFFIDSPSRKETIKEEDSRDSDDNEEEEKEEEVTLDTLSIKQVKVDVVPSPLILPTPSEEDNDDDNDDNNVLSPSTRLSVRAISTDGTDIPMPNFNELVRGPPKTDATVTKTTPTSDPPKNDAYDCTIEKNEEESDNVDPPVEEFPPLEPRFQEILVQASDFTIDQELGVCGTGAFGTVYKATRNSDQKVFALKFFGYAKRDPQNLDILETEIDVMLKLKGSDVFAQIESFFYDTYEGLVPDKKFVDAYPVIVMEYLEHDLLSFLAASTSSVIASTLPQVFKELIEGLQCLHKKGFLHRDLKVENVMISAEKKVKLIDFGFLCALDEGEEEFMGPQTGTIGYFAPESIPLSGYSVFSAKSDIWQAGVVLYTLITGKMPFNISSFNIRKAKYPPPACPSWERRPEAVVDLISNILKLNPHDRFTTEEILTHEWLQIQDLPEVLADTTDGDYLSSINNLIQRRHIKKILQYMQDDAEGVFDRSYKAETILDSIEITGGKTYFMIRMGSMKSLIMQNISNGFNLHDVLTYAEFCQLMAKNALLELTNVEVFSRFCHEHGYYNVEDNDEDETAATDASTTTCTLAIKELLLTLIALIGIPDQDDDALACFLKFDTNCSGYLEKTSIMHIFRGLLEDEAMNLTGRGDDSELDDIENELKEIETVFACLKVQEGKPGIDFVEFKQFHDSVMKISTHMSTRLSMRSLSVVSMAVGKFTDTLHSIRLKKQSGLAKTVRSAAPTKVTDDEMSKTL
mmetsp:Transcript_13588/g.22380  ORF Transcript_13588/g.22380 Transcript_13588/m.22380 type:complete len:888 (+) Transcript_13588:76-2739(+)